MAESETEKVGVLEAGIDNDVDDVELSLQGITMLLNNEWEKADSLFTQHKSVFTTIQTPT